MYFGRISTLHRIVWLISVFFSISILPSLSVANTVGKVGLSGGIETFREKEFDSDGTSLVKESGYRYVATVSFDSKPAQDTSPALFYQLEASGYLGNVDYEGKSQSLDASLSNLDIQSKTEYLGGRAEAVLGYHIKFSSFPHTLDINGGLGIDTWTRNIRNSIASNGTQVSGIREDYTVYYGKLALGLNNPIPLNEQP